VPLWNFFLLAHYVIRLLLTDGHKRIKLHRSKIYLTNSAKHGRRNKQTNKQTTRQTDRQTDNQKKKLNYNGNKATCF